MPGSRGGSVESSWRSSGYGWPELSDCKSLQAVAACCLRCWKHSRQKTGRPCVGLNGTVVSLPHCEHVVRVSTLLGTCPGAGGPSTETLLALHALQRLGSFLNCLSWKNSCSPAVKINSEPQSIHFSTLSWNSIPHPIPRVHPARLGKREAFRTRECAQSRYAPPLKCTLDSAPCGSRRLQLTEAPESELGRVQRIRKFIDACGEEQWAAALRGGGPIGCQSCSLRAFLRLRLRARASLTRFFSPGFR
jgi:hypothetical protein